MAAQLILKWMSIVYQWHGGEEILVILFFLLEPDMMTVWFVCGDTNWLLSREVIDDYWLMLIKGRGDYVQGNRATIFVS
jgi:hypothetical protein